MAAQRYVRVLESGCPSAGERVSGQEGHLMSSEGTHVREPFLYLCEAMVEETFEGMRGFGDGEFLRHTPFDASRQHFVHVDGLPDDTPGHPHDPIVHIVPIECGRYDYVVSLEGGFRFAFEFQVEGGLRFKVFVAHLSPIAVVQGRCLGISRQIAS